MSTRLLIASLALLAPLARAQFVDAHVPDADPTTGVAANSIPFNPNFGAQPGAFTQMLIVPASFLTAQGVTPGAQLYDLALAPSGSGTLTMPSFQLRVGHLPTVYPAPQLAGAFADSVSLYDSDASGPYSWSVFGNQWCSFGLGGGGFTWDGVRDVGVYTSHQGLILSSPTGWPGTFWRGGSQTRLYAPGYAAASASVISVSALKVKLGFATGPDAFAYSSTYGVPTAGQYGNPFIFSVGEPQFDNASFGVILANASPFSTAVLAWSAAAVDWPIGTQGHNVRMAVDLSGLVPFGFFVTPVDGAGLAGVSTPIGSFDPALAGLHLYAQWFVLGDAGGKPTTFGVPVAATAGLALRIGL
jgi:hypothetical protein